MEVTFEELIETGSEKLIKRFISEHGRKSLMEACKKEDINKIKLLLEHGVDISKNDDPTFYPLYQLVSNIIDKINTINNFNIIELLLQNNVNVDGTSENAKWTALMLTCRNADKDLILPIFKLLLQYKANIHLQNLDGWSTLMLVSRYSNTESSVEIVKLLLQNNIDITLETNCKFDALYLAITGATANQTNLETVKLLVEHGCKITDKIIDQATGEVKKYLINNKDNFYYGFCSETKLDIYFPGISQIKVGEKYYYGFKMMKENDILFLENDIGKISVLKSICDGNKVGIFTH